MSIERILEAHADDPQLDPVHELATKRDAETVEQEIGRLERLRGAIKENRAGALNALTPEERANLARYADCLVESIAFFRTAREDGVLDRALVRREPAMFRQVEAGVESMAPGEKAIMIAHCNHLCRVGADTLRARNPSLGEMIEAAHPGEVFSIWMLYDHGAMLNPMNADLIETLESDPERVEHAMAKAGSTYLLPLGTDEKGERYLAQPRNYSYFTWFETGTLTKQTDALFFLDVVSPLHE
jgi:erythromycin esterase-like protein